MPASTLEDELEVDEDLESDEGTPEEVFGPIAHTEEERWELCTLLKIPKGSAHEAHMMSPEGPLNND